MSYQGHDRGQLERCRARNFLSSMEWALRIACQIDLQVPFIPCPQSSWVEACPWILDS